MAILKAITRAWPTWCTRVQSSSMIRGKRATTSTPFTPARMLILFVQNVESIDM